MLEGCCISLRYDNVTQCEKNEEYYRSSRSILTHFLVYYCIHAKKILAMTRLREDAIDVATIQFLDEVAQARGLRLHDNKVCA